jgi:uncharacterized 2Fe-2S/4Fe-4S cluster protein (DUF4445 family)
MDTITIEGMGIAVQANPGKTLLESLAQAGVMVEAPCGGKGICGKCRVLLIQGSLSDGGAAGKTPLSDRELESGYRLACSAIPDGDVTVRVPDEKAEHRILSDGYVPDFQFEPSINKRLGEIWKPALDDFSSFEDLIMEATQGKEPTFQALRGFRPSVGLCTFVYDGADLIGVENGDTTGEIYGISLDIGTTTVVASLIDMSDGSELAVQSAINPQKQYGLDVLSRITYAQEHGREGLSELQRTILESFSDMTDKLCEERGIDRRCIYQVTVAANSTMLHLLLGVDPASIGTSPFSPVFTRTKEIWAADIGIELAPGAKILCLPSVSSYIGADIVAGVCVSGMAKGDWGERVLFIDIGTNGEIVLADNGRLISCSCAAGPALEGMNISFGMRAAKGAIEDIALTLDGTPARCKVIGDVRPVGICGSGILGAVREMLKVGLVRKNGRILNVKDLPSDDPRAALCCLYDGKPAVRVYRHGQDDVLITQNDVRQVQLAKGAILSGFQALLDVARIDMESLDKVLVAGQFGAHLPVESLVGCGILPRALSGKIEYLGNSSKAGAYIALLSLPCRKEMEELRKRIRYVELSVSPNYERIFAKCLAFPEQ